MIPAMNQYVMTLALIAPLLVACAAHDGLYEPSCVAYEGDRIELQGGEFTWYRFTDERKLGNDGKPVEAFPDFPKTGKFTVDAGRITLTTADGKRLDDWFLIQHAGEHYLLTGRQHASYLGDGALPHCALKMTRPGS
jgi:hypothetical protein